MRIYTVKIELENDAFKSSPGPEGRDEAAAAFEVGRILDELSESINKTGELPRRSILDANGNTCGAAYIATSMKGWTPHDPSKR